MSQAAPADMQRLDGEIIPPELAVKAMRDSGYKNTAYALAELIDNSVQAKATNLEVICIEAYGQVNERSRRRIQAIGILDNGNGMLPEILRLALQFGNGTHLTDREGIGRFGMGLPNSSISQCRRMSKCGHGRADPTTPCTPISMSTRSRTARCSRFRYPRTGRYPTSGAHDPRTSRPPAHSSCGPISTITA